LADANPFAASYCADQNASEAVAAAMTAIVAVMKVALEKDPPAAVL